MKTLSIKKKLSITIIAPLVIFLGILIYNSYVTTYENLVGQKKQATHNYVKIASNIVKSFSEKVDSGTLTESAGKKAAIDAISSIKYGEGEADYFWINDTKQVIIYHPKESLIGKDLSDFEDKGGEKIFTEFVNIAKENSEGGFNYYLWPSKNDPKKIVDKLSYVKLFKKWGWVLGTGIYIDDVNIEANKILKKQLIVVSICTLLLILLIIFVSDKLIIKPVGSIVKELERQNTVLKDIASDVSETSDSLSSNANEESSSLQETVTALHEIMEMVNRTSEDANKTMQLSDRSKSLALEGKSIMNQLEEAINIIKSSSNSMADTLNQNNNDIKEILKLISEIKENTKVINDIVFQTKLLSFNASVEAARAGDQGKGFSVVAEEVGNLASLSGNSSEAIEKTLNDNISRVESIVNHAEAKVKEQITSSGRQIETGINITAKSTQAFETILQIVDEVNRSISQVSHATHEQSTGVSEINNAMQIFKNSNNITTKNANQTAKIAQDLKSESEELTNRLHELSRIING